MNHPPGAPEPSQTSDSLLHRLAGPSVTKAGLAKDQTEITRVIAEASKGSKFYENEKRKDRDLTERIGRILKQRDEVRKGADLAHVEHAVDQLLAKMEAQRDLTQVVVHVDMDAFYASVELLDNPELKGSPFAVGFGVLTTASYEARKYGLRSGMPAYIAKKLCPDLRLLANNFSRYSEMSSKVMNIFRRYDPNMQPAGVDEAYLNITSYCEEHNVPAEDCVQTMRDTVEKETRLTVSAGIAPNKARGSLLLAALANSLGTTAARKDKNKPNGQFKLDFTPEAIMAFTNGLSIRKVPGVGRVNERLLESIGIKTCGDIYTHRATISLMDKQFGLHFLLQTYLGIGSNLVEPGRREERKSVGSERTFSALGDKDQILAKLEDIATELEHDLEQGGWTGKTVTLKYKLDTYQVFTRAKSFDRWISTKKEDLFAIGKELLLPELPLRVRLIGLRVTKLKDLRANPDDKPGGIKRFFEVTDGPSSPKKRKVERDPEEDEQLGLSQDGYVDAMPGYHEHNDDDVDNTYDIPEDPSESAVRDNPESDIQFIGTSSGRNAETNSKPPNSKDPDGDVQAQTCPICSKAMQTDNRGMNAHIDFCLSKGAIREAQAMASTSTPKSKASAELAPPSKKRVPNTSRGRKKSKR